MNNQSPQTEISIAIHRPGVVLTDAENPERELSALRWLLDQARKHAQDKARGEAA